jgi:hypothetical protein
MTARADFARLQFDWLRQVQDDAEISGSAFALAFAICRHVNSKTLTAWPTQETLARTVRTEQRTIRRLTTELRDRGHLSVSIPRGRHKPNVYRLVTQNRTPVSSFEEGKADTDVLPQTEKSGHLSQEKRTPMSYRTLLKNTLRNSVPPMGVMLSHPPAGWMRILKPSFSTKDWSTWR